MMKRRVLVLSTSVGSGHQTAAVALEQAFRHHADAEVVSRDVLELTNDVYRALSADAYQAAARQSPLLLGWLYDYNDQPFINERPLRQLWDSLNTQPAAAYIRDFAPDITVCTHFTPAGIVAQLMAQQQLTTTLAVVTTDYDFQAMWLSRIFHRYFVALEETRVHMTALGIDPDRITVSGIPVSARFCEPLDRAAVLARYGLRPDLPLLLISAGAVGGGPAQEVVAQILQMHNLVQAVVVCGRNDTLRREVELLVYPQAERFRVLSFSQDMPDLMRIATLFIGKPGGLTASECMVAGLPMLIVNPIPGQEERNSSHLLEEGAAIRCNDLTTVAYKIDRLLDEPGRLAHMRGCTSRLARPDAARLIVETLLDEHPDPAALGIEERRRIIKAARGLTPPKLPPRPSDIALYDDQTGIYLGAINAVHLQFLREHLEEEHPGDDDYYIDAATVALLEERGADPMLSRLLRQAISIRGHVDIRWVCISATPSKL